MCEFSKKLINLNAGCSPRDLPLLAAGGCALLGSGFLAGPLAWHAKWVRDAASEPYVGVRLAKVIGEFFKNNELNFALGAFSH